MKQTSKQNITRDIEIKNNLTATSREGKGGGNEGKKGRDFRTNYTGHMDKTKVG